MERGAGASNLKMRFNLKTIPDGQMSVRKEVDNYYAPQLKDVEYTMQATVNGELYANQPYTFFEQEGDGTTDSKGQFKLKHDQTAVFENLTVGDEIEVKEVNVGDVPDGVDVEEAYNISYTVTDSSGQVIEGGEATEKPVSAEMPPYGSITFTVTNRATFTRPLKLVKTFDGTEENKAPANFEATYTPVSYTHLDVYKRQELTFLFGTDIMMVNTHAPAGGAPAILQKSGGAFGIPELRPPIRRQMIRENLHAPAADAPAVPQKSGGAFGIPELTPPIWRQTIRVRKRGNKKRWMISEKGVKCFT